MYNPAQFREDRLPVLHDAVRRIAFATLVTHGDDGIEASHVPMVLDAGHGLLGVLRGHLARANPQWRRAGAGSPALAIFLGPQAYVSPAWYPTKAETGKVVPTWNYLMVHARGEIRFIEDRAALLRHVGRLTQAHEASRALPWAMEDAPADYIETMLRGIVGFEIAIATIEGKWKMSQNRNAADRDGVVAGLEREAGAGGAAVAAVMAALKTDS